MIGKQVSDGAYEVKGMAPGQPTVFHRSKLRKYGRDAGDDSGRPRSSSPPSGTAEGWTPRDLPGSGGDLGPAKDAQRTGIFS